MPIMKKKNILFIYLFKKCVEDWFTCCSQVIFTKLQILKKETQQMGPKRKCFDTQ